MSIELKLGIKLICCIRHTISEYDATYNLIVIIDRASTEHQTAVSNVNIYIYIYIYIYMYMYRK